MLRSVPWTILLSSGLVIVLLLFSVIMLMVTPTDSATEFRPLVRQRAADNNEPNTTEEEVQQRIMEIYNRKGFSNPDPHPEDYPDEPPEIVSRIDSQKRNRTKRPVQKVGKDFDPTQSYVIKHDNGTLTYVFPEKLPEKLVSTSTSATSTTGNTPLDDATNFPDKTSSEVTFRTGNFNSRDFVFPNDLVPTLDSAECRSEYPVCTKVENYPIDLVNNIVSRYKSQFAEVFGNDVVVETGDKLVQRFDTSDDEFLCASEEKLIHPQGGYNAEDKQIMIVNTKTYIQGVRVETCSNHKQPCKKLEHLISLYRTECKQIYHFRTLLAIDPVTKNPYKESFRLPSCCKCVIRPLDGGHVRRRRSSEGL